MKVNPKHSSTECRNCGHIDRSNVRFVPGKPNDRGMLDIS
ncbi:hypothetical protein [Microseira sp. BLCC-F43]